MCFASHAMEEIKKQGETKMKNFRLKKWKLLENLHKKKIEHVA
jgi:hypothetical protein